MRRIRRLGDTPDMSSSVAEIIVVSLIVIVLSLAPLGLLILARRKQKRGSFPDIDPGLGGYEAFPVRVAQDHPANGRSDSLIVDDDPVERIRERRRADGDRRPSP